MMIICDSNEQATNPKIVEQLSAFFPSLSVSKLTCGDINVITDGGKVLAIERKEAHDLLGSIGDGRVFRQVENMAAHADYYAIIVIGGIAYNQDDMIIIDGEVTNWSGKSVRAAMIALQWSACPVLQTTLEFFPRRVKELTEFYEKPEKRMGLAHRRIVTFPPVDDKVEILAMLPGVGLKRATSLLKFLGSDGKLGSLGDAFCWISAMSKQHKDVKPEGWGDITIANCKTIMGLKDSERFVIKEME